MTILRYYHLHWINFLFILQSISCFSDCFYGTSAFDILPRFSLNIIFLVYSKFSLYYNFNLKTNRTKVANICHDFFSIHSSHLRQKEVTWLLELKGYFALRKRNARSATPFMLILFSAKLNLLFLDLLGNG